MTRDPFSQTALGAIGGQMAQVWQTLLETWWKALLSDPRRPAEPGDAAVDPAQILSALELLEARVIRVETDLKELARNLAAVVTLIQKSAPGSDQEP